MAGAGVFRVFPAAWRRAGGGAGPGVWRGIETAGGSAGPDDDMEQRLPRSDLQSELAGGRELRLSQRQAAARVHYGLHGRMAVVSALAGGTRADFVFAAAPAVRSLAVKRSGSGSLWRLWKTGLTFL